ncbi:MAG: SIMPL domain-containing protein [Halobacteria archaeon]|nr:SIMPL domain-containing protein [Halobacteria archaeon]
MRQKYAMVAGAVVLSVLLLTGVYATAGIGSSQAPEQNQVADGNSRTITVSTVGEVKAQPDKVIIHVASTAVADNPTEARQRLASNVSDMREALSEMGISSDQIRTTDFDLFERRPEKRRGGEGDGQVEYHASQEFTIEVMNISKAGDVIDTAVDNGATQVRGVQFTLSKERRTQLRKDALKDAMSTAKAQAQVIANSANLSITGVHSATTGNADFRPVMVERVAAGDAGGGTSIDSGPVTVHMSVQVTYNATNTEG